MTTNETLPNGCSRERAMKPAEPYMQTATRRREIRRSIRNALGTSSDPAPAPVVTLKAARDMAALLNLTTSGRYGLAVFDFGRGEHRPISSVISEEIAALEERRRFERGES